MVNVFENINFNIVDTAGLSDTNGIYYNIANAIGLQMALHNSKSVKILFLIKESTLKEERGILLRKQIGELLGYV